MIATADLVKQLHAVEAGWWHDCPEDVKNGLLKHRSVIDCLSKGVYTDKWSPDVLQHVDISTTLMGAPALLTISPDEAAKTIVAAYRDTGPRVSPDVINKSASRKATLGRFKRKLVAGIRRMADEK